MNFPDYRALARELQHQIIALSRRPSFGWTRALRQHGSTVSGVWLALKHLESIVAKGVSHLRLPEHAGF